MSSRKPQAGKLKAAEMSGSLLNTNLGMFGTSWFNPIINQPNFSYPYVSATIQTPVVADGSCRTSNHGAIDHRIVDGGNGAKLWLI